MSLYSHNFELLPRPLRSVFSIGSEATRATLPDFDNVQQLTQFTRRLLIWHFDMPSAFAHAKFGIAFILFLILFDFMIISKKVYDRSFWILRIVKREEGSILVPNSILMFSVVEGIFGILFIGFLFCTIAMAETQTMQPQNIYLWLTLPWIVLIFGALWAAWGTYFATPNALQSALDGSKRGSRLQRMLLRPSVINWFGIAMPTFIAIVISVPSFFSNAHGQRALNLWFQWQRDYPNQSDFSQEMVQATQVIWFELLKASKIAAITYTIWVILAFSAAFGYTFVSWGLISAIRQELAKDDNRQDQVYTMRVTNVHKVEEEAKRDEVNLGGNHLFTRAEMEANVPVSSFFPPVRPQAIVGSIQQASFSNSTSTAANSVEKVVVVDSSKNSTLKKAPAKTQRDLLRTTLNHIYVQTFAVTPACIAFAAIALFLSLTIYSKMEQPNDKGGIEWEHYVGMFLIIITWTVCLAGSVTVTAIWLRTFEPVLNIHVFNSHLFSSSSDSGAQRGKKAASAQSSIFETHTHNNSNNLSANRARCITPSNLNDVEEEEGEETAEMVPIMIRRGDLVITETIEQTTESYEEKVEHKSNEGSATYSDDTELYFKGSSGRFRASH